MCGRFVLSDARWAQDYNIDEADLHLSYNIKPTQGVALVTPKHEVQLAHWWLIPSWRKGGLKVMDCVPPFTEAAKVREKFLAGVRDAKE